VPIALTPSTVCAVGALYASPTRGTAWQIFGAASVHSPRPSVAIARTRQCRTAWGGCGGTGEGRARARLGGGRSRARGGARGGPGRAAEATGGAEALLVGVLQAAGGAALGRGLGADLPKNERAPVPALWSTETPPRLPPRAALRVRAPAGGRRQRRPRRPHHGDARDRVGDGDGDANRAAVGDSAGVGAGRAGESRLRTARALAETESEGAGRGRRPPMSGSRSTARWVGGRWAGAHRGAARCGATVGSGRRSRRLPRLKGLKGKREGQRSPKGAASGSPACSWVCARTRLGGGCKTRGGAQHCGGQAERRLSSRRLDCAMGRRRREGGRDGGCASCRVPGSASLSPAMPSRSNQIRASTDEHREKATGGPHAQHSN